MIRRLLFHALCALLPPRDLDAVATYLRALTRRNWITDRSAAVTIIGGRRNAAGAALCIVFAGHYTIMASTMIRALMETHTTGGILAGVCVVALLSLPTGLALFGPLIAAP